jgi:hercynylcysteine S-oxide lyase
MENKLSPFGVETRSKHFCFAEGYRPLNHGSFGTVPKVVLEYQRQLQIETEARPDTFIRYTYLKLLKESRSAVAPLLGADPGEVVFVPNATTGVNTVLRNLSFSPGDVVLCFNTIYGACSKTIQAISEASPVSTHEIGITYPIQDDEIVRRFRLAVDGVKAQGKNPKLAMFDTVLTFPGARFPWEALVATCKELGIMSFIDGAHGIGHIDLTNLGHVGPDFMVSNCYKYVNPHCSNCADTNALQMAHGPPGLRCPLCPLPEPAPDNQHPPNILGLRDPGNPPNDGPARVLLPPLRQSLDDG